jgi:hypothetical protein
VYARSIIDRRLEIAERHLGFRPEYHMPTEIDDFNGRLQSKYSDAYGKAAGSSRGSGDGQVAYQNSLINNLTPKLNADEIRWIQNERALCWADAEYWMTRYYYIKTQTAIIRFEFRAGQRVFFNVLQRMQEMGAPIELIMAKARQLGISTVTEGLIVHSVNFGIGVNAVVASADEGKTGEMSKMTFLGYDSMDWWLKAPYSRRVESNRGMLVLGGLKSGISFQHGAQMSGIGRGSTFLKYHLSEVASYNNAEQLIEAALFRCVHPHPDVFGVLESTAEGNTGWFYDTYSESKSKRLAGEPTRLVPLFLPFTVAPDQYPNKTWIRTYPIPRDWRPVDETRGMMERAEAYIRSQPDLSLVMGSNWECSREQAWYWEANYFEARAKGTEKLWLQEMPVDDREAFQSSYDNVFGREVIAEIDSRRRTRYNVYGIVGQSIEDRHEPDDEDLDHDLPRVPVKFTNRKNVTFRWELVPLNWEEWFDNVDGIKTDDDEHMNKLFVWLPPEPGYRYAIGIRTGTGIGIGTTVISVSRRARNVQECDEQAAEFRSNDVSHVEAFPFAMAIAAYYAKFTADLQGKLSQPYVAIEQVESVGDTVYMQMRKLGYRNFHKMTRYDSKATDMQQSKRRKVGWFSYAWSSPIYTDTFVLIVRNGWFKVNSPFTIFEMDKWEAHVKGEGGKVKYMNTEGVSDAGLLAAALAAFCVNDMKSLTDRSEKRFMQSGKTKPVKLDIEPTKDGHTFPLSGYNGGHDEALSQSLARFQWVARR